MNLIEKTLISAALIISVSACSSGSNNSEDTGGFGGSNNSGTGTFIEAMADPSLIDTSLYPSNAELDAAGGVPTVEQAEILIPGRWSAISPGTGCETIFSFDTFGNFSTSALDQRASGFYFMDDSDGGLEVVLDYESENFRTDCLGFQADSDSLDSSVSYSFYVGFNDQNNLIFSNTPSLGFELFNFGRQ